ncbi:uncharacterized protein LOC100034531 isoform 2 [Danio rerio]|uniref:Uncharacterized protein LOC100034531 isoform 2 n=1 Tax=Danio rerio TaxID=7955 RepID=Q1LXF5_DANRE|nr:uncharacterized protein LOC100034531 isoform 2 [Danio rerio]|eukprot:NP_001076551.1 uncharacterized protein LOC100034531 isoform 2 [Danio rerio]
MDGPESCRIKHEDAEELIDLMEENGETGEQLEAVEKHQDTHGQKSTSLSFQSRPEVHFTCPQCGKSFSCEQSLNLHMKFHRGTKPYECDQCDKIFTLKTNLNEHMKIHNVDMLYTCDQCGKKFPP